MQANYTPQLLNKGDVLRNESGSKTVVFVKQTEKQMTGNRLRIWPPKYWVEITMADGFKYHKDYSAIQIQKYFPIKVA